MTTLSIEMPAGVAGDMLLGALLGLGGDLERLQARLAEAGLPTAAISAESVSVSGIQATRVTVDAPQEADWSPPGAVHAHGAQHGHRHYREIRTLIEAAALPERVRERALRCFRLLAEAEATVHGVAVDSVHFHEVGALDAIVDVLGCCLLLEELSVERVLAGPFTLGQGFVDCAHGRMPVPVPAVVELLARSGAPHRRLDWDCGELTTPTGCALVCALADEFSLSASHAITRAAYGAGHRSPPGLCNVLRCSLGASAGAGVPVHSICELRCELDDISGEEAAWLREQLLRAGALDAVLLPALMKKGRPGFELVLLAAPEQRQRLADVVLQRSPTIGIRWQDLQRYALERREESIELQGQRLRCKVVRLPDGGERCKPEADDVAEAAAALDLSFGDVQRAAIAQWQRDRAR